MGSKREHLRINCASQCILIYEGVSYHALLDNISLGGALLKTGNEQPENLYIGATVELMLCGDSDSCPTTYTCEVTRLDSSVIGVNFLMMNV